MIYLGIRRVAATRADLITIKAVQLALQQFIKMSSYRKDDRRCRCTRARAPSAVVNGEKVTHDLRRANEFHVALLAMAGHDLRQPLQVVISSYDWLSRRVDKDLARKHLDRGQTAIIQLIEQLDHLVSALRLHERESGIEGGTCRAGTDFCHPR